MATIRDVAKACGVSAMTISNVLNNRPGNASPETVRRIRLMVEEMGYQPNAIARGLTRRRMNTLGIILSYEGKVSLTSDRYFSPILDGIFAANKQCHQKTLVITEDHWETVQDNMTSYLDGHCDGFIFVLPILPPDAFQPLLNRKVPFVLVGESRPEESLSTVDMDNVGAAYEAVSHLIAQGHRKIAFLKGDDFLLSSGQREAGYRQALDRAGIPTEDSIILPGNYNVRSGYVRTKRLLDRPIEELPTALFCCDDWIARGAIEALMEEGLSVPADMSIIGVNDDKEVAQMQPGLTTVHQPLHEIGEKAVEMVLAQISRETEAGEKQYLKGEMIHRGSVAPPSSALPADKEIEINNLL